MSFLLIVASAFIASLLTFFSGFGLGTMLMPVFAIFFPIPLAVAMTAVVHLLNNLFKAGLVGKFAHKKLVIYFGVPALLFAFLGALCLVWFETQAPLFSYELGERLCEISTLKLVIASLILIFIFMDLTSFKINFTGSKLHTFFAGSLSGFFGGVSGHQGAFRSMYLIKCGLTKESFIATNVLIACMVDVARLFIYSSRFQALIDSRTTAYYLIAAVLSAFLGAYIGKKFLHKLAYQNIKVFVSLLLGVIALGLGAGLF